LVIEAIKEEKEIKLQRSSSQKKGEAPKEAHLEKGIKLEKKLTQKKGIKLQKNWNKKNKNREFKASITLSSLYFYSYTKYSQHSPFCVSRFSVSPLTLRFAFQRFSE